MNQKAASALEGAMENHVAPPHPPASLRSMGLVLKWERKCKTVLSSSHLSTTLPSQCNGHSNVQKHASKYKKVCGDSDFIAGKPFFLYRQHTLFSLTGSLLFCHRGWHHASPEDRGCVLWSKTTFVTDIEET